MKKYKIRILFCDVRKFFEIKILVFTNEVLVAQSQVRSHVHYL